VPQLMRRARSRAQHEACSCGGCSLRHLQQQSLCGIVLQTYLYEALMGKYVGGSNLSSRLESKVPNDLCLAQLRLCSAPFALTRRLDR